MLPFDRPDSSVEECFAEIERGLETLDDQTLLFLSSVKSVRYVDHVGDFELSHDRTSQRDGGFRRISITLSSWQREQEVQKWWVWSRELSGIDIGGRSVEFAVRVEKDNAGRRYEPRQLVDPKLVVFFPTEKPSHLGMLLQGPFRTTPARDNVPERDETNRAIVGEASTLLVDMLTELRDRNLLTPAFLESLPLDPDLFEESTLLRPLHDAVVEAFRSEALIPTLDGSFTSGDAAALGRTAALRDLLGDDQVARLLHRSVEWVSPTVDDGFRSFLEDLLEVPELTPEGIISRLDREFLEAQTSEWICRLYEFIHGQPALYRMRWNQSGVALRRPIIRMADGTHSLPFDEDGHPRAYLPSERPSRLPQIDSDTVDTEDALDLLTEIGLPEPDLVGEVCEFTIPSYQGRSFKELDIGNHLADVQAILEALDTGGARSNRIRQLLEQVPTLVGVGATTGRRRLCTLSELVVRNESTRLLLGDEPDTRFVDDETYGDLVDAMDVLGIRTEVTPDFEQANRWDHVIVRSWHSNHCRGLGRFDPNASCDALKHALASPTIERSRWIWNNIAVPFRFLVSGEVERATRQDYSNGHVTSEVSPLGELLSGSDWLPFENRFVSPTLLELDDLPPEFQRNTELATALGMKAGVLREFSKQTNIPADVLEGLEDIKDDPEQLELVRALLRGNPLAEAREIDVDERIEPDEDDEDSESDLPFDAERYEAEFKDAFDRPAGTRESSTHDHDTPSGDVLNPSLRRERTAQEVEEGRANEPVPAERFQTVPRRLWERKKNSTRDSLRELYGGTCQICSNTFAKADGSPYFEGLYLVSYTKAAWLDQLGNVLSLCPTCSAKFQFSEVHADDVLDRVRSFRLRAEGGNGDTTVPLVLAGEPVTLTFKERHVVALQTLLTPSPDNPDD